MSTNTSHVLLPVEAEAYVQSLERFVVKQIGGPNWSRQHEQIEKLNMQAIVSASSQEDEFVKEFIITYEKIPFLIHDLLATEVWKQKVFPELIEMEFEPATTFPLYITLYHEATVANLLETVLFHQDACEAAEDSILDLLDYCYRKLTYLVGQSDEEKPDGDDITDSAVYQELLKQEKILQFEISIKAVSILRYITDHITSLPLSIMSRALNTLDLPLLLVHLVENPPWTSRSRDGVKKFIDGKWQDVPHEDSFKLTKTEGQVWIALFNLLMGQECQQKYELNEHRKNTILKLRSHLTVTMLDQMPALADMQRYLEHLSMMDPPSAKPDLVLEQIPEIRDSLLKQHEGQWDKLAKKQSQSYFSLSDDAARKQAKRWADTYRFDVLEELMVDPPKCALCGEQAAKRCSRCQNEWYCRRECQVKHWKKHKAVCDLLHNSLQQMDLNTPVSS